MPENQTTECESEPTNEIVEPAIVETAIVEPAIVEPDVNRFASLSLIPEVQQAVESSGYEQPTPIQSEIIPHMLQGRDVLAQSQTGTGKTAAFALPILTRIETECKTPQVLVLVPTRELAIQVAKAFSTYGAHMPGFRHAVIYGGQDYEIQYRQLRRGPQVVVGTPGRVIDHINKGTLNIGEISCLVLDEADEMLNMGFLDDVEFVLQRAPERRQIALFSATLPGPIRTIADRYLNNPAKITIKDKTMTADSIRHRAVFVAPRDKIDLLVRFLEAEETDGVIVFTRTREATNVVAEKLQRAGLRAVALNGEMPQRSRERTIQSLVSGQLDVLVATDVAARGLDVSRISHVFNYDLPEGPEAYTHRVGRTGRAGKAGEAIIFLSHSQRSKLHYIEKVTRQPIEIIDAPSVKEVNATRIERFFKSLDETIANRDMAMFRKLVSDYASRSGHSLDTIAAAIAMLGQNGRDFLMKDRPARRERENRESGSRKSDDRHCGQERGDKKERFSGPPVQGMARYRIAVGKRDGVRPGNIVGAVTNEAHIDGEDIGSIRIHESYSTIDLPRDRAAEIVDLLSQTRVSGKPLNLKIADGRDDRAPARGYGKRKDDSNGHGGYSSHSEKPRFEKKKRAKKDHKDAVKDKPWQKAKKRKVGGEIAGKKSTGPKFKKREKKRKQTESVS